MKKILYSPEDMEAMTHDIVDLFVKFAKKKRPVIVKLSGNLGAGKTTLVKYLAKHFGIKEQITSPTFVIQKSYSFNYELISPINNFVHIDAYRLEGKRDINTIKWRDLFTKENSIIFIEWPENIADELREYDGIKISISHEGDNKRGIDISYE